MRSYLLFIIYTTYKMHIHLSKRLESFFWYFSWFPGSVIQGISRFDVQHPGKLNYPLSRACIQWGSSRVQRLASGVGYGLKGARPRSFSRNNGIKSAKMQVYIGTTSSVNCTRLTSFMVFQDIWYAVQSEEGSSKGFEVHHPEFQADDTKFAV